MSVPKKRDDEHEALVKAAEEKWEHDQLVEAAEAKWSADHSEPQTDLLEAVETAARGLPEGLTDGASEPFISTINAGLGSLITGETYPEAYGKDIERRRMLKSKYPGTQAVSEITGAFTSPLNKVFGAVGKGAGLAAEAIPGVKALLARPIAGAIPRVAKAGLEGAAIVAGSEGTKRYIEENTGFIQPQDDQSSLPAIAKTGAVVGSGIQSIIEVLKAGKYAGGKLALGILAAMGGVKPEKLNDYLARGQATKNALSPEEAKYLIDKAVEQIHTETAGHKDKFIEEVLDSLKQLKEKVNRESKESYAILDKHSDKTINIPGLKSKITREQTKLQPVKGAPGISDVAETTIGKLQRYRDRLDKYPKKITLVQAKKLLQQMGHDLEEIEVAGAYGSPVHNAVSSIRDSLNKVVKKLVPEYEAKMATLSEDTKALGKLRDKFGTPEKVSSKIDRFSSAAGALDLEHLQDLQIRSIPGQRNQFNQHMPGQMSLPMEASNPTRLTDRLGLIQKVAPLKNLNEATTESFMKSIFHKSSINNRKKLELIASLTDKELVALVENAGIKDAFTKDFNAGSLNVNLWTVIGGGMVGGYTGSQIHGIEGGIAGAVLGSMVRVYGPATTKLVLDGVNQIKGMPTIRKIDKYIQGVPPELTQRLKRDLIRAIGTEYGKDDPIQVPKEEYHQTMIDIDGANNMNNVDKAKAINILNRTGEVSSEYFQKIMTDGGHEVQQNQQIQKNQDENYSQKTDYPDTLEDLKIRIKNLKE